MSQDRFATLRSLLQRPSSLEEWNHLITFLQQWPDAGQQQLAVDYAEMHLNTWDDRHRIAKEINPELPWWSLIRHVNLQNANTSESIAALESNQEVLAQITCLTLGALSRYQKVTRILSERSGLSELTYLDLERRALSGTELKQLMRAPALQSLQELHLNGTHLTSNDWRELFSSAFVSSVRRFALTRGMLDFESLAALAQSPHLRLEELLLDATLQDPMAATMLASATSLRELKALRLRFPLQLQPAEILFRSPLFQGVDTLELRTVGNSAFWRLFVQAHQLSDLRSLTFSRSAFDNDSWRVFLTSPALQQLEHLCFFSCDVMGRRLEAFRQTPFPRLTHLDLSLNTLNEQACKALARHKELPELRKLVLGHCRLTNDSVGALLRAPWMKGLEVLDLRGNAHLTTSFRKWIEQNYTNVLL